MIELLETLHDAVVGSFDLDNAIADELAISPCIFTQSVDSALTIIPKGWLVTKIFQFRDYEDGRPGGWGCVLNIDGDDAKSFWWSEHGETAALAICTAAISAHITMNETAYC